MAYKNYFYISIETTSKAQSLFDLKLDDERGHDIFIKKWENMQKFEKDWMIDVNDAYVEKAPLIPEFGKIICLSFGMFPDDGSKKIMTIIDDNEEVLIKKIVKVINRASETRRTICGFNVKSFDLPFLIKKMYKYNIDIPLSMNFIGLKPWEILVKDLSELWKGSGKTIASLEEVAYEFGIDYIPIIEGNDVHSCYWGDKDKKILIEKCEQQIDAIIQIAEKLKI